MKKLQNWLGHIALSQQLLAIIATSTLLFGFFFFGYLRSIIQTAVLSSNYSTLNQSQKQFVEDYQEDSTNLSRVNWTDSNTSHLILKNGRPLVFFGSFMAECDYNELYRLALNQSNNKHLGELTLADTSAYYLLTTINDTTQVLSITSDANGTALANILFNNVSNVAAFVVGAVFLFMVFWVTTLIHPLNQIKQYIDSIRSGKDAVLKINRTDEIGEVATAVVSMREELKHQDEVKEEMIHNISHDLKTPIATIKSYAESIKDGIYPYETLDKSVDVIIENADRLDHKVHSLLFLNRLDYLLSSQERQMNSIDMNEIAESVKLGLRAIRPEVSLEFYGTPTVFRGEEESWRILVENLVDNALRYAKSYVRIELKPGQLKVSNDGNPIDEEQMKKLFKPFEKGDKGKFGLGLSICSKVAEAYGYTIEAVNQPYGVSFVVTDKTPIPENKDLRKKEKERESVMKMRLKQEKSDISKHKTKKGKQA